MDRSKLNQLFKAAKAGNVARIRELLAAVTKSKSFVVGWD
jgi:hypothetical protein